METTMGIFKTPHPDCKGSVYGVYTNRKGRLEVAIGGCDRIPDTLKMSNRNLTPAEAIEVAQGMLDEHRTKGLRGC
ncbi:hypothetical protein ACIBHX_02185 [Nonomuraea sp. NPDC050536]|uniref:hypothetical protein n=1 Tax=Nonomuraea sp. NPDC050536 TaxID=3364366 RepID=UPI0037C82949